MITAYRMDVFLKNETSNFEMLTNEISESGDEIEVYTNFFNPLLKRGWVGDLTYYCYKGYIPHNPDEVKDTDLMTVKDILLRNVQLYQYTDDGLPIWKYTFLKG